VTRESAALQLHLLPLDQSFPVEILLVELWDLPGQAIRARSRHLAGTTVP
jgi:hypothetical protein